MRFRIHGIGIVAERGDLRERPGGWFRRGLRGARRHRSDAWAAAGGARGRRLGGSVALRILMLVWAAASCATGEAAPAAAGVNAPRPGFTETAVAAGLRHVHHRPILDRRLDNIMSWVSSVGAAAAAADFDRDGWVDLYVTDSRPGFSNHLYRNRGDGTFEDVASRAGLAAVNTAEAGASMDCVWGDYDNDGWADLYLVRWGSDSLYRNRGDGTFTEVTRALFRKRDGSAGIDWANGCAAIFFDADRDGRLDIYVGNYFDAIDLWHLPTTRIMHDDFEKARNGGRNFFYRQNPDGTFTERAASVGLDDPGWTLAVGAADLNNDGWPDLYCADDFGPDQLFLNDGRGGFTNVSATAIGIDTKKGMNVDFGDLDGDGWLDIYVANITTAEYLQEGNMLWHNNGPSPSGEITFTDIALETGTYDGGWGWGAKFFDADNDGDLDLYAVNGFISAGEGNYWFDLASWTVKGQDVADAKNWPTIGERSFSGYEKNRFWRNDGPLSFTERAAEYGLDSTRDGRGLVCFDYDNDGDLDLFVANQNQAPLLYRNDLGRSHHWLSVHLLGEPGPQANRDALGARVTIVTGGGRQLRENNGGKCYSGQSDPRLHFGLGPHDAVKLLEVRWPDGGLQYLEDVPADRVVTVRQDPTRYVSRVALPPKAPQSPVRPPAAEVVRPAAPRSAAEVEAMLAELESGLGKSLATYGPASRYRSLCAAYGQHERPIRFFESLLARDPRNQRARLELGCAYVDKIPTCGGMAAIVSKGRLARQSLDQFRPFLAAEPDSWIGHYVSGMNHLHWPRALRHSDDAVLDFARCLELQRDAGPAGARPFHLRAFVGLGDAHVKAGQPAQGRAAWRQGLERFPDARELRERLGISEDGALLKFVESQRSLERAIDTDLSFVDP